MRLCYPMFCPKHLCGLNVLLCTVKAAFLFLNPNFKEVKVDEDEKKPEEEVAEDEKPEEQPAEDEQPADDVPDFASIADLLAQVLQGIADMRAEMATALQVSNAAAIDNGAAIVDDAAAEPDVEIVDTVPELAEDRDYSI